MDRRIDVRRNMHDAERKLSAFGTTPFETNTRNIQKVAHAMAALRRDLERRLWAVEQSADPEQLALSLRSVREFVHKLQARLGSIEGIEEKLQRLQDSSGQWKAGFIGDGGSGGDGDRCCDHSDGYNGGGSDTCCDYSGG